MKKRSVFTMLMSLACALSAQAQFTVFSEAQLSVSDGKHTPLWLNANRYGLSSLKTTNGYVRAGAFRSLDDDSLRRWKRGFGADVAVASRFTSDVIVQQLYGEIGWHKAVLTLGAKEQPSTIHNQELSTGPQTLGINARPVPALRLELPDYWNVPGTRGWLGFKGHISYGMTTDDSWQKEFTHRKSKYTEHTWLHTKTGILRFGRADRPFNVEFGIEMGCQFGGRSIMPVTGDEPHVVDNEDGICGMVRALVPGGSETEDEEYENEMGNHVGSWLLRANIDYDRWGVSVYADHFFEDQSQMFFLDYDGYGTGDKWDSWEHFNWMLYDLRDIQLGAELRLKQCRWVNTVVAEYIYTKYQSGPVYHDHTRTMSDHVGGIDLYYSHGIFIGWQHWGQVMGNPLYTSSLYNENCQLDVQNTRFVAWHLGVGGSPAEGLRYRLLSTWQKGWGTYRIPYVEPRTNFSLLAETSYEFPEGSSLAGWKVKAGVALDRGDLLGDNTGMQLTIGRRLFTGEKKR